MSVVLGIDTGGTFTDFVLVDHAAGLVQVAKVPSTPSDPGVALAAGLSQLEGVGRVDRIVIGTTVATNAAIERDGPRVVFITNAGFEDVPFIGRLDKARLYDLNWKKTQPLLGRRDAIGVAGRIDHHGNEVAPLTDGALEDLRTRLAAYAGEDVAVAICCLFSYLEPAHEKRLARVVRDTLGSAHISISHEVSPLWREFERASTTIADVFVKPVVSRYVNGVSRVLEDAGIGSWNMLASNGGYLSAGQALHRPAQLLLSGLAGGVIGGRHFATAAGEDAAFILDVGGTSSDIGLVRSGSQQYANEFDIDFGIPVTIPCVAVETIGAGGGSIGWVDKGGLLHVGPRSAGAEPGPAAYGRGGTEPTVTDANLVLGRLNADYFLGGAVTLDMAAARASLSGLGTSLGLGAEDAARAMIRTVNENMANAIRLIAVRRGLDVRDFALMAFGGAGPLHGAAVARVLGMRTVVVPPHPGLCSAFGAAIAEARIDRMQTLPMQSDTIRLDVLDQALARLASEARGELIASVPDAEPRLACAADMRYLGQNYEIETPLPGPGMDAEAWLRTMERFAQRHKDLYGFDLPNELIELVNLRVTALDGRPTAPLRLAPGEAGHQRSPRPVWLEGRGAESCAILSRSDLRDGRPVAGPCIIEEVDSTTLVGQGDSIRLIDNGLLVVTIGAAS